MGNFYRHFFPGCACILRPLTDLLRGNPKTLQGTVAAEEAYQDAKQLLTKAVPLQQPSPQAELSLATSASDSYIGGVLQQKSDDHWCPLGFFSRKLCDTESHYSTFDRELLAANASIRHFHHFCEGHRSSLGRTTNLLSLHCRVSQILFRCDSSDIWLSFPN